MPQKNGWNKVCNQAHSKRHNKRRNKDRDIIKDKNMTHKNNIVAYVLAGGESRRFGNKVKGMQLLHGKPLVQHVINRLLPQVHSVNINSHIEDYTHLGHNMINDIGEPFQGPLSGLLACMKDLNKNHLNSEWLLITPCDSPFIPKDMVDHLLKNINSHLASCISYENNWQPPFSMWHKSLLPQIENAVLDKQWGGLKKFLKTFGDSVNVIEYPEQENNPFFNINCIEELQQAEKSNHE